MDKYLGLPGFSLVRPQDDSKPWRLCMGLEDVHEFLPGDKPTMRGLVLELNKEVAKREGTSVEAGTREYSRDEVRILGKEIFRDYLAA